MSAEPAASIHELGWDERRGSFAMAWFIATEAALFVVLFFSYFYLGRDKPTWPASEPPKLLLATIMLAVLLTSSAVLTLAERLVKRGKPAKAKLAVLGTVALGGGFIVLQVLEYREHLKSLTPGSNAYGSIFYTITSFHGAHLLLGLAMLIYVLLLPQLEPAGRPPHRPLHNAALYWHFVDVVWVLIVAVLYYGAHIGRG